MPPADPLTALLELVRTAAREGTTEALAARTDPAPIDPPPLLDKRALAHALGISTATVDRLCRQQRILFVAVGEVRRFDLLAVRAALTAHRPAKAASAETVATSGARPSDVGGIRLLSRAPRR